MGGYGSGRPSGKQKAEEFRSLDVNRFHREGILTDGRRGHLVWSRDGAEIAQIDYHVNEARLVLDYRVRQNGGDWGTISQPVPLIYAQCHYGGQRPYFQCLGIVNGQTCRRRVIKIYAAGKYFLCRHCYNLAYSSQSEEKSDRMLRRANKIRTALGGERGTAHFIAPKPKGMSQRKYQQKRFEIEWCEGQANQLFLSKFRHLLSKEEQEIYFGEP
jgi:hypothetical protein